MILDTISALEGQVYYYPFFLFLFLFLLSFLLNFLTFLHIQLNKSPVFIYSLSTSLFVSEVAMAPRDVVRQSTTTFLKRQMPVTVLH